MRFKILLVLILFFSLGFTESYAKSYEIPEIKVEVSINADGTIRITEQLTYNFDGSFSWAEYRLPKQGYRTITDVRVSDGDRFYLNENSEQTGTFSVSENSEAVNVRWYYDAEDEARTFTISYTLEGAVTVGPEWTQFFWNYLSSDRDKDTEQLDIAISLPKAVATDSLYGWTRGPAGQIQLQKSESGYTVSATDVSSDEFVKVRTVFPVTVFSVDAAEVNDPEFSLSWAQADEQAYREALAEQRKREAYLSGIARQASYVIVLLSLIIFYFLYQKYGKRHSTSRLSSTETIMIPDQTRPAPISWLMMNRTIMSNQLMATLLDLARRGYFKIREELPEEGFLSDDDPNFSLQRTEKEAGSDLPGWERDILQFAESRIEDGTDQLVEIFKGSSSEVSSWFTDWQKCFKAYCFDQHWVDLYSYRGSYWNAGLQLLLFLIILGVAIYTDFADPVGLLAGLFVTVIAAILSLAIIRRAEKGEALYHRWNNYKKGLKNAEEHEINADLLDRHFIYAVALAVEKKHIETLFESATAAGHAPAIAWFVFHPDSDHSPANIANTFSTLGASGTSSFAGTAGGAGAAAGAAGGGASASAG